MAVLYKDMGYYAKALERYEKALEIDYEINLIPYLPYHLLGKTICLYEMNVYEDAKEWNEKFYNAAKEIDNREHYFRYHILKEKINFKLSGSTQQKIEIIENMKSMLTEEKEDANSASLNYEISFMLQELNKDSSEFAGRAIEIYRNLYEKTPRIEYKNRYEELENITT
jgi:tetratricopeptide (TPR) repeat protein